MHLRLIAAKRRSIERRRLARAAHAENTPLTGILARAGLCPAAQQIKHSRRPSQYDRVRMLQWHGMPARIALGKSPQGRRIKIPFIPASVQSLGRNIADFLTFFATTLRGIPHRFPWFWFQGFAGKRPNWPMMKGNSGASRSARIQSDQFLRVAFILRRILSIGVAFALMPQDRGQRSILHRPLCPNQKVIVRMTLRLLPILPRYPPAVRRYGPSARARC